MKFTVECTWLGYVVIVVMFLSNISYKIMKSAASYEQSIYEINNEIERCHVIKEEYIDIYR